MKKQQHAAIANIKMNGNINTIGDISGLMYSGLASIDDPPDDGHDTGKYAEHTLISQNCTSIPPT